jgi:hypothetical protein
MQSAQTATFVPSAVPFVDKYKLNQSISVGFVSIV